MQALIRLLYALLVAGAVVTFVGFGIYSLYQPPKYPDYPDYDNSYSDTDNSAYEAANKAYDKKVDAYEAKEKIYQRNATYIALPLAVAFIVGGLLLYRKSDVVGEGIALGGIGTSIYAIVTSSLADARVLRFISVTVLLTGVLLLTYRKFYPEPKKR